MDCEHCGAVIGDRDTRYEQVTPLQGGGQTSDGYCSVKCLNAGVEFSEQEIVALMRQSGYNIPVNYDSDWEVSIQSNIGNLVTSNSAKEGEYNIFFESRTSQYDIEIYHDAREQIYQIAVSEYSLKDGEKVGHDYVEKRHTAVMQRALAHAEDLMEVVDEGEVES